MDITTLDQIHANYMADQMSPLSININETGIYQIHEESLREAHDYQRELSLGQGNPKGNTGNRKEIYQKLTFIFLRNSRGENGYTK